MVYRPVDLGYLITEVEDVKPYTPPGQHHPPRHIGPVDFGYLITEVEDVKPYTPPGQHHPPR